MHRISRILLLLGLSALILAAACSSAGKVKSEVTVEAPTRHVLHNGVRVLLQDYPFGEVVAVQLWVRAGGRDEAAAELGLAHYLEHMLFKGTTTRSKGFVDRDVEALGGYVNAGTSLDFTYYYVVLPATRAVAAIEMLADISVNSSLDETELELEKKVVIEEMRLGEDTPQRHLTRQLYGMVVDGHPYGRSLLGTPEIIQKLTRNTLLALYGRLSAPDSSTLVVVGPITKAAILQAAERPLGRLPRSGFERLPQTMPATLTPKKNEVQRPGALAYLGMAWLGPKLDHADTPAVELLASILGQSRSSRLPQSLRARQGLVNSVRSDYVEYEAGGVIMVTAQLESVNLARAETETLNEIRRIRDQGVSDEELRRAITRAEAERAFRSETAEG